MCPSIGVVNEGTDTDKEYLSRVEGQAKRAGLPEYIVKYDL